jgi:hypothetical protein
VISKTRWFFCGFRGKVRFRCEQIFLRALEKHQFGSRPTKKAQYKRQCRSRLGIATMQLKPPPVTIMPPADPTVFPTFGEMVTPLYAGPNPIQRGMRGDPMR